MFHGVQDEYKQLGIYIAAGKLKQQEIQQQISRNFPRSRRIRPRLKKFMISIILLII